MHYCRGMRIRTKLLVNLTAYAFVAVGMAASEIGHYGVQSLGF